MRNLYPGGGVGEDPAPGTAALSGCLREANLVQAPAGFIIP
jgi:hypothetical protein